MAVMRMEPAECVLARADRHGLTAIDILDQGVRIVDGGGKVCA
jgi:hypothetical protein